MSQGMARVLLTGSEGQLGRALCQTATDSVKLIPMSRKQLDIMDQHAVQKVFLDVRPDWIVNAAAYTKVDQAESEQDLAFRINADGPAYLAEAAVKYGARMVQISTDYVFDGNTSTPYLPNDLPNPLNVYGASKLSGEQRVAEILGEQSLILRTAWIYSLQGPSFLTTMLKLLQEREEVRVVEDQFGTPTCASSLAHAVLKAIFKEISGIHHWTGAGVASWYDFACAIREYALTLGIISKAASIKPISSVDYPTPARRSAFSVLDKSITRKILGIEGDHWRIALRRELRKLLDQDSFAQ